MTQRFPDVSVLLPNIAHDGTSLVHDCEPRLQFFFRPRRNFDTAFSCRNGKRDLVCVGFQFVQLLLELGQR